MIRLLEPIRLTTQRQFNSALLEGTKTYLLTYDYEWLLRVEFSGATEGFGIKAFYDRNLKGRDDCVFMDSIETMNTYWMLFGAKGEEPQMLLKLGFGA